MKYIRSEPHQTYTVADKTVVFNQTAKKYYRLNETGEFILALLNQPHSVQDLSQKLCNAYCGVTIDEAVEIIARYLDDLLAADLVKIDSYDQI